MAELFMSFIHEEQEWAEMVNLFIRDVFAGQVDSFLSSDRMAIYAGEDWMSRVFKELKEAKVVISMLSPRSVARPWINFEAGAAWMRDTKVIPVCFGGLNIDSLPKPYSSLQAVDIEKYEGSYYLVSSVAHYLGIEKPKKPIFTSNKAVLTLSTKDPEENKKLFRPYKFLQSWMRTFEGIQKDPG